MTTYLYLSLGFLLGLLFVLIGSKRDNQSQFFGTGLIVAILAYVVFALFQFEMDWLKVEAIMIGAFLLLYKLSIRGGILYIGLGWLLHPLWDYYVHIAGPGVNFAPEWYAWMCISFDLVVGAYCLVKALTPRPPLPRRGGGRHV